MSFNSAINRLKWRLSNGKSFVPNKTDIESFNEILDWVNTEKKNRLNQNRLFAKLYIERLAKEIVLNNLDYQKSMKRVESHLRMPLEVYYNRFSEAMRHNELSSYGKMLGIEEKPISWMDEEKAKEAKKLLKDNQKEFISVLESDFWNIENTTPRLNDLITDILNTNSDLP